MANPEHLKILKQGVKDWNKWREKNPEIKPDLRGENLRGAVLRRADLRRANLEGVDLREANLSGAYLHGAGVNNANLRGANLSEANLSEAELKGVDLNLTVLIDADLRGADLSTAEVGWTCIGNIDLSEVKGLDTVKHLGPSTIGIDTIYRSKGNIPDTFMRGAGVPDNFIEYMFSLTGKALEYYSCFISHSSKDQEFVDRLYADLQNNGVRCWFAPENMKIGDKIRQRIDQSIRIYDKLLLILSENSINSEWVEDECEAAYEEERKREKPVLFPVRIDDAVMDTKQAWAAKLRRSRHIGDFTNWRDHDSYTKAFDRLLRDLRAEG